MPLSEKFNSHAPTIETTGFGTNSNYSGGRFYNSDGSPNISVRGVSFLQRFSLYNSMLNVSNKQFLFIILFFYFLVNLLFATLYYLTGIENLGGIEHPTEIGKFWDAFFFSAQTLSTVGYGHVYPKSYLSNIISATESVLGLLTFALATGIMYGRFSKPKAYIRYSKNALYAPFKDGTAIMFRVVPYKHNHLMDAEAKATLVMKIDENGVGINRFFSLPLEIPKINSLILSWTLVHLIDSESPFYNLTKEDLRNAQAELLVFVKAFDESFSTIVVSRTSYIADEFVFGAKFKPMYNPSHNRDKTYLHVDKLDHYEKVPLPQNTNLINSSY